MSNWKKIKNTSEYQEAVKEVEKLIEKRLKGYVATINELVTEVGNLREELDALKARTPTT